MAYSELQDMVEQHEFDKEVRKICIPYICANCRYCAKLYVPPSREFDDIPKDKYVCTVFWDNKDSDHVQYLGDNQGMCEMFTERKRKK